VATALFSSPQLFGKHRAIVQILKGVCFNSKRRSANVVEQKQPRHKFVKVDLVANHVKVRIIKERRLFGPNETALGACFEAYRLLFFHFSHAIFKNSIYSPIIRAELSFVQLIASRYPKMYLIHRKIFSCDNIIITTGNKWIVNDIPRGLATGLSPEVGALSNLI